MRCLLDVKVKLLTGFSKLPHHKNVWGNRGIARCIPTPVDGEWLVSCTGYFTFRE